MRRDGRLRADQPAFDSHGVQRYALRIAARRVCRTIDLERDGDRTASCDAGDRRGGRHVGVRRCSGRDGAVDDRADDRPGSRDGVCELGRRRSREEWHGWTDCPGARQSLWRRVRRRFDHHHVGRAGKKRADATESGVGAIGRSRQQPN